MHFQVALLVGSVVGLSSCSGDGAESGSRYCSGTFQGGGTSFACTSCNGADPFVNNPFAEAIDNNASTALRFGFSTGGGNISIRIQAPTGQSFPAGANAGGLIQFPKDVPLTASYSLYRGNTLVAATSGGTIATASAPSGSGSATYYPVTPSATVDRIDLAVSAPISADLQLVEVCGDR